MKLHNINTDKNTSHVFPNHILKLGVKLLPYTTNIQNKITLP